MYHPCPGLCSYPSTILYEFISRKFSTFKTSIINVEIIILTNIIIFKYNNKMFKYISCRKMDAAAAQDTRRFILQILLRYLFDANDEDD